MNRVKNIARVWGKVFTFLTKDIWGIIFKNSQISKSFKKHVVWE